MTHSAENDAGLFGLAKACDVLPDGRIDHRGHLADDLSGDGTRVCLDCTSDDEADPWIVWTIPHDADGRPMPKGWRDLPFTEVLLLCGMTRVTPPGVSDG